MSRQRILILDFGGQYTQLIARRVREAGVYSEILPFHASPEILANDPPAGVVLSGGPESVADAEAPRCHRDWLQAEVPVLGICYGMQLLVSELGGRVEPSRWREYGRSSVELETSESRLLAGWASGDRVWMSHGDTARDLPAGYRVTARSDGVIAAVENDDAGRFGIQFHPEVHHTPRGAKLLSNFVFDICGCMPTWTPEAFVDELVADVRAKVGDASVLCALSGGVDSAVTALLLRRALGDRVVCVMVDTGLLRLGERAALEASFEERLEFPVHVVDARRRFLDALEGVEDPETKRKIIGREFIAVFAHEAELLASARSERFEFLAQGTLYPDVIESMSVRGPSVTIKSHHNVGGLPEHMPMGLIEPLRELFKDEVRRLGVELGLDDEFVQRHPFPGPGLAVRVLGPIDEERLERVRGADAIFIEEIRRADQYDAVWQAFAVLLPVRTVGVMGDRRTYDEVIALRAVNSVDGMTADWAPLPYGVLQQAAARIVNEVEGVNRVVYDISTKPPSTIEWE